MGQLQCVFSHNPRVPLTAMIAMKNKSFDMCKSGGSQKEQEENNKHDLFIKM
jgi:hypothetical protein